MNPSSRSAVFRHAPIVASPGDEVVEEILVEIMVPEEQLAEARRRRKLVCDLAMRHPAARDYWFSGSLAHGTQNAPLGDADCGVFIDRRIGEYRAFGPDAGPGGRGPEPFIRSFASFLEPLIIEAGYANARINLDGNRAIKIEFNAPVAIDTLGIVDPFVDLILGLDRRGAPGVWIPNRRRNDWDPAHPQRHTELMTQVGDRAMIVHRAHVIRLEKRAVKRDGKHTGTDAICSWNLSALALGIVTERGPIANALAQTLAASAASIAHELTEDPAHVAGKIALPDGMTRETTSQRLGTIAGIVEQAATAGSIAEARRILSPLFGVEIDNIRAREQLAVTRDPLNRALRGGDRAGVAAALGARTLKPARSDGDHQ